jgi:hypothetical protein
MARDPAEKVSLRAGYLRGLTLEVAATQAGVPIGTARNWKREAAAGGDDWDRLRSAQLLAGGSIEEVTRRVVAAAISQTEATLEMLNADTEMKLPDRVQAIASLGDSLTKMSAAVRKMMPETDVLAVQLGTMKRFAEFIRERFPASAPALLEALEAFGEEVAKS